MPFPARIDPHTLGSVALGVVEDVGWEAWSLRKVAGVLGVSPNALYRHTGGRGGLAVAVAEAAVEALSDALHAAPGEGLEGLLAFSRVYLDFGLRRPHAYAAFVHAKPAPDHPRIAAWFRLWLVFRDRVAGVVPDAADACAFALWALVHGRLELARGPARLAAPDAGLDDAIRALVAGYLAAGPVPTPLPPHVPRG